MRIEDYDTTCDVTNPADIAAVMNRRDAAGRNAFWLAHGEEVHPVISILVVGDLDYLHYFPTERHPGFASVGDPPCLKPGEVSEFFPEQSNESFDIMNEAVVPFSDALRVAQEFSVCKALPKSIPWSEL